MNKSAYHQTGATPVDRPAPPQTDQQKLLGADRYSALQHFRECECARIRQELASKREKASRADILRAQNARILELLVALLDVETDEAATQSGGINGVLAILPYLLPTRLKRENAPTEPPAP